MSPRVSEDSGAKMKTDWTGENAPLGQQVAQIYDTHPKTTTWERRLHWHIQFLKFQMAQKD